MLPDEVLDYMVVLEPRIAAQLSITSGRLREVTTAAVLHEFRASMRALENALEAWDGRGLFDARASPLAEARAILNSLPLAWFVKHVDDYPALTPQEEAEIRAYMDSLVFAEDADEPLAALLAHILLPRAQAPLPPGFTPLAAPHRSWWSLCSSLFHAAFLSDGIFVWAQEEHLMRLADVLTAMSRMWARQSLWSVLAWDRVVGNWFVRTGGVGVAPATHLLAHRLAPTVLSYDVLDEESPWVRDLLVALDLLWWRERDMAATATAADPLLALICERHPETRARTAMSFLCPSLAATMHAIVAQQPLPAHVRAAWAAMRPRPGDLPARTLLDVARPFATLSDASLETVLRRVQMIFQNDPPPRGPDAVPNALWTELFQAVGARLHAQPHLLDAVCAGVPYTTLEEMAPCLPFIPRLALPGRALLRALGALVQSSADIEALVSRWRLMEWTTPVKGKDTLIDALLVEATGLSYNAYAVKERGHSELFLSTMPMLFGAVTSNMVIEAALHAMTADPALHHHFSAREVLPLLAAAWQT